MKAKNIKIGQRVEVKTLWLDGHGDTTAGIKVGMCGVITRIEYDGRCYITFDGNATECTRIMHPDQLRKAPVTVEVPKIKVGDRVICLELDPCDTTYGIFDKAVGTVLEVHENYYSDGASAIVDWDNVVNPKGTSRHMYCAGKHTQLALLKPVDGSTVKGANIYAHTDAVSCIGRTQHQGVVGVLEDNGLVDEGGKLVGIRFKCGGYLGCLAEYVSEIVEIPNET